MTCLLGVEEDVGELGVAEQLLRAQWHDMLVDQRREIGDV